MKRIITFYFVLIAYLCQSQSAVQFNGTNAYITFGNNINLGLSQFSLECWFKRLGSGSTTSTGTGGVTGVPLITKGRGEADGSNVDMNYFLGIRQSDSTLVADFEEGALGTTPGLNHPIAGITRLARNVWYHVAITYDGATWKLYLNGQLESQLTVSQPVQNLSIQHSAIASALTSNGTAQGFFNGIIDEVRIWNNARPQMQIISTINSAITSTASGLVARWGLNEGSGTSVASSAGTGITGTITGSNWSWVSQQAPFNLNIAPNTPTLVSPADSSKCTATSMRLSVNVSDLNGDSMWVKFYGRKKNNAKDFSIIPLPDTQYYTSQINGANNSMYKAQMNWVVAKKDSLNIQFISGLGDCVENGDNGGNDVEWKRADTCMKIVETNTTGVFPWGIPYGLNVGNHDQSPNGNPNGTTTYFNQYFGVNRFMGRSYWGGNYSANADNNYQLFSAEGMDFIVINLEYDPSADPAVLSWANGLLQTYPNRLGIVSSHWFLNLDGSFGAQGQATYNALKNNPNFFLMLCGHVPGEARRTDVYNNKTVHCILSDYQGRTNGGNGWIRIMKFRPSLNKINVYTYSPSLKQSETDADSQFILDYDFGTTYTLIDSVKVASGQTASINWTGLQNSASYEWQVKVKDASSIVTGQSYSFKTSAYKLRLPNDTSLCGGPLAITPLSALSPSLSFLWMNGASSQSISLGSSTMVILQVTDSLNCTSKDTMNVSINTIPALPGTIFGNSNPCLGSSQNYSIQAVAGAVNYTWTLPASWNGTFTGNNGSVITGTNNGSILVVAGNSCGVSPSSSLAISVNSAPATPGSISGKTTLCVGDIPGAYSIAAVPVASSYSWSFPATWTGTVSGNTFSAVPGTSGGTISVAASNSCGISATQTLNVIVNALPVLSVTSTTSTICYGSSVMFSVTGASNYTWSSSDHSSTISVSPASTSTYTVNGTDANGCSASAAGSVSVIPVPSVSISGNSLICKGDVLSLSASGANSYTWSTMEIVPTVTAMPVTGINYTITGAGANGCTSTASKSITVNPSPTVTISGSSSVCAGGTLTLSGAGANIYLWSTSATSSAISVTPGITTTYSLTGTDANNCSATALTTVTVYALPVVSISGNTSICSGNTLVLTGNGAGSYLWSTSATTGSISISPSANTIYTVTGTDVNGCVSTASLNITVNPAPTVSISGNNNVCIGNVLVLSGSGASTYLWSTASIASSISVSPTANSIYTLTGTDQNNCSAVATKSIMVNALPLVSITGNSVICLGDNLVLTATGAAGYLWSTASAGSSISVSPAAFTSYSVTGTDANGCSNTAVKMVLVNPLPNVGILSIPSLICAGETATLFATSATTYTWNTGATTASITVQPLSTTNFTVTGADNNSCSGSAVATQSVTACTGINSYSAEDNFRLYPNPNNGSFVMELPAEGTYSMRIFNITGQEVYSNELRGGSTQINLQVKQGIYVYQIMEGSRTHYTGKIIIN